MSEETPVQQDVSGNFPLPPDPVGPLEPAVLSLEDLLNDHSVIAQKEAGIRANPLEQSTSILKQVFGK